MLPPLAALAELESRLGSTLTGNDLGRAQAALEDASALIRGELGRDFVDDHGDGLDWGDLTQGQIDAIQSVCLAVAFRAFKNPDGVAQASVGDVSVSYGSRKEGAIFLTAAELRAIRRTVGLSAAMSVPVVIAHDPVEVS